MRRIRLGRGLEISCLKTPPRNHGKPLGVLSECLGWENISGMRDSNVAGLYYRFGESNGELFAMLGDREVLKSLSNGLRQWGKDELAILLISMGENSGILTDIPTENEILGIYRGISEEIPRKHKIGVPRKCVSSEFRRIFPTEFRGKKKFRGIISDDLFRRFPGILRINGSLVLSYKASAISGGIKAGVLVS
ncbi:hypothetical protein F2Q69_00037230 [Brassica cretica]|uniref:Uncharacterized protein n=1 Tax=Brassica cretica TaxID=69181 RepID=A0A8S9SW84_BRACR|nr:hypothetical protein F2Q69_00037230 [Brassica cretica]